MPTYEYRCTACKHEFEHFQSMRDKPLKKCPSCGKSALERLIGTGAAVIFKGGGFYQTDYRSESYRKAAEADAKASTPSTGDSDKKTDASATPKTEATPASSPAPIATEAPARKHRPSESKAKPATKKKKKA